MSYHCFFILALNLPDFCNENNNKCHNSNNVKANANHYNPIKYQELRILQFSLVFGKKISQVLPIFCLVNSGFEICD